ncbi:hypothetical protein U1Q18_016692 [Sarracenia purpurea var. burkii]
MGSLCCCFQDPDVEETVDSSSSHHGNCFIQNLKNGCGACFGRQLPKSVDSRRHSVQISGHVHPASEDEDVCPTCLEETSNEIKLQNWCHCDCCNAHTVPDIERFEEAKTKGLDLESCIFIS